MTDALAVHMQHITKRFAGVLANDNVSLDVRRGEVHALLGENGAGKSTLMKILYGLYQPDSGSIEVGGQPVVIRSPADSLRAGIGMVPQNFILVPPLRVVENVALGLGGASLGRLDLREVARHIQELAARYGWPINPNALVRDLSLGERQRIEILKALYRQAKILILDEPTSVLTPREAGELMKTLRQIAREGGSVIFISHKLNEVLSVSDRVTVMRDGRSVGTTVAAETDKPSLARMMVGREVVLGIDRVPQPATDPVLEIRNLSAPGQTEHSTLRSISFTVRRGEIIGIAGVDGNGQAELASILCGVQPHYAGDILLCGRALHDYLRQPSEGNLAYIPADRQGQGLVTEMSVGENLTLRQMVGGAFISSPRTRNAQASMLFRRFNIKAASLKQPVSQLSGGNQQRVVFARETGEKPILLVAAQATQGLDIAATEDVFKAVARMRDDGVAIIYISTELDEILALSDRMAILSEGRLSPLMDTATANVETIGLLMGGVGTS